MKDNINWNNVPDEFVIFDLETTGLDAYYNDILEIGAIRFNKNIYLETGQVDSYHALIKQDKPIPKRITEINSITDEMVKDGTPIGDALSGFFDFAGGRKLVAFNAPFDSKFIRSSASKANYKLPKPFKVECALQLARARLANVPNYKLTTLAQTFKVDTTGAHRALQDCMMTLHVYVYLIQAKEGLTYTGSRNLTNNQSSSSSSVGVGRILGSTLGAVMRMLTKK